MPEVTADPDDLAARKAEAGIEDCPTSDPQVAPREDGLPDLVLPCLGGGDDVRLAGLRGTPMVVNVWAQWCGPCRTEAPHLAEVSDALADTVLFLGIDYNDPRPELAIDFAGAAGWSYPQVTDEERVVQPALQLAGPPMTVFVDADGRITHRHPGVITSADQLRDLIAEHLGVS
ncbi:MAG TPA: TlpA family protein disulfide reductase [Candidatus Avipropionibacterium avicola]|uniref:TlpA family protein disulfide reductase n=1 Tax=Candidatus Avipropionibacterium avicola TaxID=2840701 RepID=A0A9D1H0D2_9ACTN|nr:TlpA family protein disulfide reductase [Candidatus Avipropionibacterium avicola]